MDEFESPELEALPFEEICDDCPLTPDSSDSDLVSADAHTGPTVRSSHAMRFVSAQVVRRKKQATMLCADERWEATRDASRANVAVRL